MDRLLGECIEANNVEQEINSEIDKAKTAIITGKFIGETHSIQLKEEFKIKPRNYTVPLNIKEDVQKYLKDLIESEIISKNLCDILLQYFL